MSKKLTFILIAIALLAAGEAPRVQLRYNPAPQTTWITEGHLTVKSWMRLPTGEVNSAEENDLAWEDAVTGRDLAGTLTQTRQIRKLTKTGTTENLAPRDLMHFNMSKLGEQTGTGLLSQPALYPARNVAVGETWAIEQTTTGAVPIEARILKLTTQTRGTGKLVRLEPNLAALELTLTIESAGRDDRISTTSTSQMHWTLHVDRAEGVPLYQKAETKTEQTVTAGDVVVPSRTETLLELKTRKGP